MILDSQGQKELLLGVIANTKIGGNLEQARATVIALDKLLRDVRQAEVAEKNDNEE